MVVLVTGVAGFIGSHTAQRLVDSGEDVVGVDSFTDYYAPLVKETRAARLANPRFRLIRSDIRDLDLDCLLRGIDRIIHLAGQPGVRRSWGNDFVPHAERNVLSTQVLLEAARRAPRVDRFVFASSSSVYGNALQHPTPESVIPQPASPYGVTKLAAENLVSLYASSYGLPCVSLRYFTVYGPSQRPDMAFARFVDSVLRDDDITVFGTGHQIRDFTFIDDVVRANILATYKPIVPGAVFNVAGGSSVSVNCVLRSLASMADQQLRIRKLPLVDGDVFQTSGDTSAIVEALGWRPEVPLDEGLSRQLDHARLEMNDGV